VIIKQGDEIAMASKKNIRELIPWYLNGTLNGDERKAVENYIHTDPRGKQLFEEWTRVRDYMIDQGMLSTSLILESELVSKIKRQGATQISMVHPYALGLALAILIILWTILRPGVVLNWKVSGGEVTSFRIYRSIEGSNEFRLLDDIPVHNGEANFRYVDIVSLPFIDYTYYIEGFFQATSVGISQVVTGNPVVALPGQLALVCASLFMGYGIVILIRNQKKNLIEIL
jgi:hypothetical protein